MGLCRGHVLKAFGAGDLDADDERFAVAAADAHQGPLARRGRWFFAQDKRRDFLSVGHAPDGLGFQANQGWLEEVAAGGEFSAALGEAAEDECVARVDGLVAFLAPGFLEGHADAGHAFKVDRGRGTVEGLERELLGLEVVGGDEGLAGPLHQLVDGLAMKRPSVVFIAGLPRGPTGGSDETCSLSAISSPFHTPTCASRS